MAWGVVYSPGGEGEGLSSTVADTPAAKLKGIQLWEKQPRSTYIR